MAGHIVCIFRVITVLYTIDVIIGLFSTSPSFAILEMKASLNL